MEGGTGVTRESEHAPPYGHTVGYAWNHSSIPGTIRVLNRESHLNLGRSKLRCTPPLGHSGEQCIRASNGA